MIPLWQHFFLSGYPLITIPGWTKELSCFGSGIVEQLLRPRIKESFLKLGDKRNCLHTHDNLNWHGGAVGIKKTSMARRGMNESRKDEIQLQTLDGGVNNLARHLGGGV